MLQLKNQHPRGRRQVISTGAATHLVHFLHRRPKQQYEQQYSEDIGYH